MDRASTGKNNSAAPWRGRQRTSSPRRNFVAVRCTAEERAGINEAAARTGLSIGAFLRKLALGDEGPRAVRRPPIERRELARLLGHVGSIGNNLNQIAYAYNRERRFPGFAEMVAMRQDIAALRAALMKALGRGD